MNTNILHGQKFLTTESFPTADRLYLPKNSVSIAAERHNLLDSACLNQNQFTESSLRKILKVPSGFINLIFGI